MTWFCPIVPSRATIKDASDAGASVLVAWRVAFPGRPSRDGSLRNALAGITQRLPQLPDKTLQKECTLQHHPWNSHFPRNRQGKTTWQGASKKNQSSICKLFFFFVRGAWKITKTVIFQHVRCQSYQKSKFWPWPRWTRPDTRHKMRLVCVLFTFKNNTGRTYGRTDGWTDGRTDGRTQPLIEMRWRI